MTSWLVGSLLLVTLVVAIKGWYRIRSVRVGLAAATGTAYLLIFGVLDSWLIDLAYLVDSYPVFVTYYYRAFVTTISLWILVGIWLIDRNLSGVLESWRSTENVAVSQAVRETELKVTERSKDRFLPKPLAHPDDQGGFNLFIGEACDSEGLSTGKLFYLPERGLFTNMLVFGSVGSAKTAGMLYPFLRQMIFYAADRPDERIGGLIFDAKDDFSHQTREYLEEAGRGEDFIYLTIDGQYILNPVNDPDMSGMVVASVVASLNDQVIGKSKEGFWKGSYIQLLQSLATGCQVAFDYTNLTYLNAFASDLESGERMIDYVTQLIGSKYEHTGSILVYRNLITNTDAPWEFDHTSQNQRPVIVGGDLDLRREKEWAFETHLSNFAEALQETDIDGDVVIDALKERILGEPENVSAELDRIFAQFTTTLLEPHGEKLRQLDAITELFEIARTEEMAKNPFDGMRDAFNHDFYPHKVTQVHFYRYKDTPLLREILRRLRVHHLVVDLDRVQRAEQFLTWFRAEWVHIDHELRFKIYTGVKNIVQFFEDPKVRRTFAPSMVCYYDHLLNPDKNYRQLFPSFDWLMSEGKWLCVGIPKPRWHLVTDVLCTLIKQQFQAVALLRTSRRKREKYPDYNFDRKVCLMIDEYHEFATAGKTMDTDNNFLSLNRQSRVFFVGSTQTIENIRGKFDNDEWVSQLLGCCRNKIFLGMEDPRSAKYASELIGKGLVYRISQSVGENQSDSPYSLVAGGYSGEKAGTNQSLSYQQTIEPLMLEKEFMTLRSFRGIAVCYDGDERVVQRFYCKPYWRPFHEAFHWQTANQVLKRTKKI